MNTMTVIGIFFGILAVFFAGLAIRDYVNQGNVDQGSVELEAKLNPARKAWILISIIFAVVSVGLLSLRKLIF